MEESKLLQLLRSFSSSELQRYEEVMDSPVFNQNRFVAVLGKEISRKLISGEPVGSKKDTYRLLYPDENFNDLKFRKAMSSCYQLAELVLALDEWEGSETYDLQVMKATAGRKLEKQFNSAFRRFKKKAGKRDEIQPEYFWHSFQVGLLATSFHGKPVDEKMPMSELDAHLDEFYLMTKLRQACVLHSRNQLPETGHQKDFLRNLMRFAELRRPLHSLSEIYRIALLTQLEPGNPGHFQKLKTHLARHRLQIAHVPGAELHILARNHCIRQINLGDQSYIQQLFDLYRLALEGGYLLDSNGHILPSAFKNIVSTGLKLKAFSEVEEFVQENGQLLAPEYQADFLNFSLGKIRFAQGQFRAVAKLLQTVSYNDLFIELDSRILLLKTWYELGEMDLLEAALNGTRKIVRRRKIQAYHRKNYLNNLKMVERLLKQYPEKAPAKFMAELRSFSELSEREWLLEKGKGKPGWADSPINNKLAP